MRCDCLSVNSVAVVGAGNIGCRHIEALLNIRSPINLFVVDPCEGALDKAREIVGRAPNDCLVNNAAFLGSAADLPERLRVCVVATTADHRKKVVESLLQDREVNHWLLEKVLFQRLGEYGEVRTLFHRAGAFAWVNCWRRMWRLYQELSATMADTQILEMHVCGSQWGLACNAIHFIDLFAFLSRRSECTVDGSFLDDGTVSGRREGSLEVTGSLFCEFSGGGRVILSSYRCHDVPFTVKIVTEDRIINLAELSGDMWTACKEGEWQWKRRSIVRPMQSQMTHIAIQQMLDDDQCSLTPFEESVALHLPLIAALRQHMLECGEINEDAPCPIT